MRKFILFTFSMLFFAASGFAQFLRIDSPAGVAGVYASTPAGFGGVIAQDEVFSGDLILADPLNACDPLTIDATDKIVLLDRGACEFGDKCLNSEMVGASVVIVANNVANAGTIVMGAGVNGGSVTIPCLMISFEDGQLLKDALAMGDVTITYGDIPFDVNLGTSEEDALMPLVGSIPMHQLENAGDFTFIPGVDITNFANVDAEIASVTGTIEFTPAAGGATTQVYQESDALPETLMIDSTRFVELPEYDFVGSEEGTYTVTYNLEGDGEDEVPFDDMYSKTMDVTTNIYSKSNIDPTTGFPEVTGPNTISGGGYIEFLTGFPATNGAGARIDSVSYFVSTQFDDVITSLENITVQVFLYEWADGTGATGADGAYDNDEVTILGVNTITYPTGAPESTYTTLPFIDLETGENGVVIPDNDRTYIVGVRYDGTSTISFGFNDNYDFTQANDIGVFQTQADFPYLGSQANANGVPDFTADFTFTDFLAPATTAIYVNKMGVSTEEILSATDAQLTIFPNPVQNEMNVSVELAELTANFEYRIMDINGRLIQTIKKSNVQNETAQFNVSDLPNGQYILTVATDKGIVSKTFTVQR